MSKGSNRRPRRVSREEWDRNYERTFGRPMRGYAQKLSRRAPPKRESVDALRRTFDTPIDYSGITGWAGTS